VSKTTELPIEISLEASVHGNISCELYLYEINISAYGCFKRRDFRTCTRHKSDFPLLAAMDESIIILLVIQVPCGGLR
jgi:hypothetical protein